MKNTTATLALLCVTGCSSTSNHAIDVTSPAEVSAYTFGYEAGNGIKNGLEEQRLEKDLFLLGMQDALHEVDQRHSLTDEEVSAAHTEHNDRISAIKEQEALIAGEKNAKEGVDFLEVYRARPDTRELEEGVLYTVLSPGEGGTHPTVKDIVEVHYEGRLIDGTVFDSSISRGVPDSVPLERVIPGWQKAIVEMTEGAEWEVIIPSSQAYGTKGRAPAIGPNQTLIFKIELLKII